MAEIKIRTKDEKISKARAAKAMVLTGMTVAAFLIFCYHVWWSIQAFYYRRFGSAFNSLVVVGGALALNAFVMIRVLLFFETRLLSNHIDADHKKYL